MGSKDNNTIGAYGRDILNDNGELLLSFANNRGLAFVNTRSLERSRAAYHILSTGKAKNVSITSQRNNVIENSRGTLRCTPSPLSFPFRTTTLCPHPSKSTTILLETVGRGPQLSHQWPSPPGRAQQELGRNRRQPYLGRWFQSQKGWAERAERGTWKLQWRRTRQAQQKRLPTESAAVEASAAATAVLAAAPARAACASAAASAISATGARNSSASSISRDISHSSPHSIHGGWDL